MVVPGTGGKTLSYAEVLEIIEKLGIVKKSLSPIRETYMEGRFLWGRPSDDPDVPPMGEEIYHNRKSGVVRFVWQFGWNDMAQDKRLNGIILFGGSTLLGDTYPSSGSTESRYFRQELAKWFGEDKVFTAQELLESVGEPELVGASIGACYMAEGAYSPIYVNRLPVRVTLENMETGEQVEYEPFRHFVPEFNKRPFDSYVSKPLRHQKPAVRALYPKTYEVTVTYPNGVVVQVGDENKDMREFIDESIDSRLIDGSLRLVIDRLGGIGVEQESERMKPKRFLIFEDTPWQTEGQRNARKEILKRQEEYEAEGMQRAWNNWTRKDYLHRPN